MAAGIETGRRRKAFEAGTRGGWQLASPGTLWMVVFFVVPLLMVLVVSFLTRGRAGVIELPLTLEHYARVFQLYLPVVWTSVWISVVTTIICLIVGYPLAFFITTRKQAWVRNLALFLVILPFWTNFLVRTYAMQTILAREGLINELLASLNFEPVTLLYTPTAVLIGLVYGYLPFMVLPIYAAAERFDFKFVSAAHDLGANDWKAFWRVVFPMTLPGVVAGCILVFVPCLGTYLTVELLGGESVLMIGKLINDQFVSDRHFPRGSAVSMALLALVMGALILYVRYGNQERA
jgi:spermidine/putrescine transport system permease protein